MIPPFEVFGLNQKFSVPKQSILEFHERHPLTSVRDCICICLGRLLFLCLLVLSIASLLASGRQAPIPILEYIKDTWGVLTRTNRTLATAAPDPKFPPPPGGRWRVYIPGTEDESRIRAELRRAIAPQDFEKIKLTILPDDPSQIREQGLLYLPRPYVVPGGRFNEMYG